MNKIITASPTYSPNDTNMLDESARVGRRRSRSKSPQQLQSAAKRRVKSSDAIERIKI
jgi:hypothetical protein